MNILLLTPAPSGSLAGNRATAERWGKLLEVSGHSVILCSGYTPEAAARADLMIALHAWRSHDAVAHWRRDWPRKPLVVALTGTDIYRFQHSHPEQTLAAMDAADQLICLHRLVADDIPDRFRQRLTPVLQSADRISRQPRRDDQLQVCVIGHLREEKDSLRAALAARLLPAESRIHILQAGKAHDEHWAADARQEMAQNPRYQWFGQLDRRKTAGLMASSDLMVISSVMEGGANVVSEACRAGLPVIASAIPGNLGLLGQDYPGYFPVQDEQALSALLLKAENDPNWLQDLTDRVVSQAMHFTPEAEQAALETAIARALSPAG